MLVLALRYLLLPNVETFRDDIERMASQALGQTVRVERLSANWEGIRPELHLWGVKVLDAQGRETLGFREINALFSWQSVVFLEPHFQRLHVDGPMVTIERDPRGRFKVAGFDLDPATPGDPRVADWLLQQETLSVANATLIWRDGLRQAPELRFSELSVFIENQDDRHLFGARARPPAVLAGVVDVRGEMLGRSFAERDSWSGQIYLDAPDVDVARWQQWIALPVHVQRGGGSVRAWGRLSGGQMGEVSADLTLRDVLARFDEDLPEFDLPSVQGRMLFGRAAGRKTLRGTDLRIDLPDGRPLTPLSFHAEWSEAGARADGGRDGLATLTQIDLHEMAAVLERLPLNETLRQALAQYQPAGVLRNAQVSWISGPPGNGLRSYTAAADFAGLSMAPVDLIPGFSGLSGRFSADEQGGKVAIDSGPLVLALPRVFERPRVALDELNAEVSWTQQADVLAFDFPSVSFSGPDGGGRVSGRYRHFLGATAPSPELDVQARLFEVNATQVARYMPKLVGADVRHWLDQAIRAGRVTTADAVLRGPVDRFPFADGQSGQFSVRAAIAGAQLRFAPDWPAVDELDAELRVQGSKLSISTQKAVSAGVQLGKVEAVIPDLTARVVRLQLAGEAQSDLAGFTRYLDQSPVGEMLGRFYDDIRIAGQGALKLELALPLEHPDRVTLKGRFDLSGGQVIVDPMLPPVTQARGHITFSERGAQATDLGGVFLGRPVAVDLRADAKEVRIAAQGQAQLASVKQHYAPSLPPTLLPLVEQLSGTLPWQAAVSVKGAQVRVLVESSLQGVTSTLPEPLAKPADKTMSLRFARTPLASEKRGLIKRDQLTISLGDLVQGALVRRADVQRGQMVIERGVLALGDRPVLPDSGLRVVVKQNTFDADRWRLALTQPVTPPSGRSAIPVQAQDDGAWPVPQLDLDVKNLKLFGRWGRDIKASARSMPGGVSGTIEARGTAGEWRWEGEGAGTLHARLSRLVIPTSEAEVVAHGESPRSEVSPDDARQSLPAIDVVAEEFVLGKQTLGRIEFLAKNVGDAWQVSRCSLSNPDGKGSATGRWTSGAQGMTEWEFAVEAKNIGKFLTRFGYPDAVRDGEGSLAGKLSWRGSPVVLHPGSMTGQLKLKAEKGQFKKLEPGLGKLLSLLSLQNLPRRVTLDFADVFSEGFAFDKIDGTTQMQAGILRTNDLVIDGGAARVMMQGEVDLGRETQNVRVKIQPEIGGAVALGAAIVVAPVVGVATLLAQKVLRDPLNRAFGFEYQITGSLNDPKVERVGGSPPAVAEKGDSK